MGCHVIIVFSRIGESSRLQRRNSQPSSFSRHNTLYRTLTIVDFTMLCAISGEAPEEPVVSKLSGNVFEKRLIEKYISEHGKDPISGEDLTVDDLLPLKSNRVVRPRPPTLTSIPALLSTFQNEWDALALETFNVREQLQRTREELATALYQHDAAVRVIARLTKERDEARDALSRVSVSGTASGAGNGDAMAVDAEPMPQSIVDNIEATQARLSKSRKKRPVPEGWVTPEEVASFALRKEDSIPIEKTSTLAVEDGFAAIGSLQGDVAVYSLAAGTVERTLKIGEPVTECVWSGIDGLSKLALATAKGSVKIYGDGVEQVAFKDHAGLVTGLSFHPSGDILASVGGDKSFIFYDLSKLKRITRVFTDARKLTRNQCLDGQHWLTSNTELTTCAFHPDGHLFAVGTSTGLIKFFRTADPSESVTAFELGKVAVQAITFSENGYWFAAAGEGQTTVTIFDIRKEGDASRAKVIETGGEIMGLDWDYSQQFLATAGPLGVTVQHYTKSKKSWDEIARRDFSALAVKWGKDAKELVAVSSDGRVGFLSPVVLEE
jgi:pre-mRNA-processing factor 19